ncbi:MAG TPA: CPBP family intramembrane glutamic endopeptidase [Anaerolineales bacterium]|nr:CPBP family intramembrane glutamic endopeptidase [Anaerolineales bacterium]
MIERKPLLWFLAIAFTISWTLFLMPLALSGRTTSSQQFIRLGLWTLAMWGPGVGAIIATRQFAKQPFSILGLNTLGPKRFYLWALFLPTLLAIAAGVLTVLFGIARFDPELQLVRGSLKNAPGAANLDPWIVISAQAAIAILPAPFFNMLFALGEELGWRGFLLPRLLPLGQWKAIIITGVIWGIWHAPVIVQGENYPGYPIAGIFMMIVFCVLLGIIFGWLYLNTRSPWSVALTHGAVNAVAALPVLFLKPGFNLAFGGTLATFPAWVAMIVFIGWLAASKRLPVQSPGR